MERGNALQRGSMVRLGFSAAPASRVGVGGSVAVIEPLLMDNADEDAAFRLAVESEVPVEVRPFVEKGWMLATTRSVRSVMAGWKCRAARPLTCA